MEKEKDYLTRNEAPSTLITGSNSMADDSKNLDEPKNTSSEGHTEDREKSRDTAEPKAKPDQNEEVEEHDEDPDIDESDKRIIFEAGINDDDTPEVKIAKMKAAADKINLEKEKSSQTTLELLKAIQGENTSEAEARFRFANIVNEHSRFVLNNLIGAGANINSELKTEVEELIKKYGGTENVQKIKELPIAEIQKFAKKLEDLGFAEGLKGVEVENDRRDEQTQPKSLEELVELIIKSEDEVWGLSGEKALMDERGNINLGHLLSWYRGKMEYYHNFNPDDPVNFLQMVQIPALYRSYGLGELIDHPRYWRTRTVSRKAPTEQQIAENKPGTLRMDYKKREDYTALKDQLLMEAYLFSISHNNDVAYRGVMGNEEKCFDAITQIYAKNDYAKNQGRLLAILKHPSSAEIEMIVRKNEKTQVSENATEEDKALAKYLDSLKEPGAQGTLGRMIRRSLLSYYYLRELELEGGKREKKDDHGAKAHGKEEAKLNPPIEDNMFRKSLGEFGIQKFYDSIVVQILKENFKEDLRLLEEAFKEKQTKAKEADPNYTFRKFDVIWNDEDKQNFMDAVASKHPEIKLSEKDTRLKAYQLMRHYGYVSEKDGLKGLNIYSVANKPDRVVSLVKKAIADGVTAQERQSLKGRLGDHPGLVEKIVSAEDSEYATDWAFSMTYWTGIAASNDTEAVGFNAWSKTINAKEYRLKQARGRGMYGDLFNIFGIRRIGLNFWEGMNVRKEGTEKYNQTLLEVLQGGEGDQIGLDKEIESFEFEGSVAQAQFANNHVRNGYLVFKELTENHGMGFEKIAKYDHSGKLIIDQKAFDKLKDEDWKHIRYWIDQGAFQLGKKVRVFWKDPRVGDASVFGSLPLMQAMVNEDVLRMGMYDRKEVHDQLTPKGDKFIPKRLGRNIFAYLIAKEIWLKTRYDTGFEKLTNEQVHAIADLFEKWPLDVEERGDGQVFIKSAFFDHHEMKRIFKLGGRSHMVARDMLGGFAEGAGEGIKELFKTVGEAIFKGTPA